MNDKITTEIPISAAEKSSRARIIAAALDEFAEHGLAGARVDRIARTAEINKAMIYYHFSSKEKLFEAVIDDYMADIIEAVRNEVMAGHSLRETLEQMVVVYDRMFSVRPQFVRMLSRELANPDSPIVIRMAEIMSASGAPDALLNSFRMAAEAGEIRPVDPVQAMVSFVMANIGPFILWPVLGRLFKISDRDQFFNDRKSMLVDIFLKGVKA